MHIRLLGGFAVEVDGVVVEPRRWRLRHARTLVAMLALAHGQRLTRDAVIDELWPEVDQAAGSHNLHQAMYVARRAVAVEDQADDVELLSVHDGQVVLAPGGDIAVDALEFEAAALEALATDSTPALESAAARYAGPLLPELPDARWAETRRAALARMFHDVLVRLGEHRVAEGDPGGGRVAFERVLADDPLNEPAVRGLMGALADEGRRSEALTRYERLGRDLLTAYATDPDRLTKELYRALLVADTPDERRAPLRSLPVPLTTMIGREREVAELERVLRRSRMTTLTGPGGAGKTRLALELAARIHRDFEHGATFVDLSALSEERFVPSVVGTALGLLQGERADPADVVTEQLGRQRVLIVLDNCEHLLRGCARLASAVLSRCPNVVLLATSREPLRVAGEAVYRVPSLELPAAHVGGADDVEQVGLGRLGEALHRARGGGGVRVPAGPRQLRIGGRAVPPAGRHTPGARARRRADDAARARRDRGAAR